MRGRRVWEAVSVTLMVRSKSVLSLVRVIVLASSHITSTGYLVRLLICLGLDASISQSALEEALLSNIQHGRMSTLSQLRSRYL